MKARFWPFIATLALSSPAWAFKEPGHRAIEAAAYEILTNPDLPNFCSGAKPEERRVRAEKGRAVLETLLQVGALVAQQPSPATSSVFSPKCESYSRYGLAVHSHMADHLFDRQLESDRQCFHFNARSGYVTAAYGNHDDFVVRALGDVPRGLVVDAYQECMGIADSMIRNVLYDPAGSREKHIGLYELMHLVEDSFADSHVARTQTTTPEEAGKILYVKPWNLRSALRYMFTTGSGSPWELQFSERHHMTSETRDSGYALGVYDDEYDDTPTYRQRVNTCLNDLKPLLPSDRDTDRLGASLEDLQTDIVIPPSCLSARAKHAAFAVAELLRLVAAFPPAQHVALTPDPGLVARNGFATAWLAYRCRYLAHIDKGVSACPSSLTGGSTACFPGNDAPVVATFEDRPGHSPPEPDHRGNAIYPTPTLEPKRFKNAGAGLTTELRSGSPLWLGVESLSSRNPASHHEIDPLLDTLAWGIQVRLPLENEIGEKPVGAAIDIGPGLPLPLSELFGLDELQIYVGLRARFAYTASSIFSDETRHGIEAGFGGVSADFIVGNQVWFGIDAPRYVYGYDFWSKRGALTDTRFSFSGGIATDAF